MKSFYDFSIYCFTNVLISMEVDMIFFKINNTKQQHLMCLLISVILTVLQPSTAFASYSQSSINNSTDPQWAQGEIILSYEEDTILSELLLSIKEIVPNSMVKDQYDNYLLIQIDTSYNMRSMIDSLNQIPSVLIAEPNYYVTTQSTNDTFSNYQWALKNTGSYTKITSSSTTTKQSTKGMDMKVFDAWDVYSKEQGSKEVIVAIVDTGVDVSHKDLKDNIWVNKNEIPDNGIDDDGNGYIDDVNGWDFYNQDNTLCHYTYNQKLGIYTSDSNDSDEHGTHIAGIIGAIANNKTGIAGVASNINIKLMPLKVQGGPKGSGTISSAIKAIKYATSMGAQICNMSWGFSNYSATLEQAIKESNMLFIAAAGNTGSNNNSNPVYPASYKLDNLISVTFIDANGNLALLSNYGNSTVDIAAPGEDIYSTLVGDNYGSMSGSSMAVPHVVSIAAMLYAYSDYLYPANVKEIILGTLTPLDQLAGYISYPGIPNAYLAVSSLDSLVTDKKSPSLSAKTSYDQSNLTVTFESGDSGGSGLRTLKWLIGKRKLADFSKGTIGTEIENQVLELSKAGYYTFYASDYAGNETTLVYEVLDDTVSPSIHITYKVSKHYKAITTTATILDSESGVKTVKYMAGKKTASDFLKDNSGTILESTNGSYSFKTSKEGYYTIYATDYRGNKTVETIYLEIIKSNNITLGPAKKTLSIGNSYKLKPTLSPLNSTDQITYSSSNASVAKVTKAGKVKALKTGTTTITATTSSGKVAKIRVTVK